MTQTSEVTTLESGQDWLCHLAAHDGYGARMDWQWLCAGQAPDPVEDGVEAGSEGLVS